MDEKELEELRASVRRIDSELAALFEKRLELSRGIALYKLKAQKGKRRISRHCLLSSKM